MTLRRDAIAYFGVAAWLCVTVALWVGGSPLGHDESQYAIAARDADAGSEPRWFYLSRGMEIVALPGIWLGGSEHALRLFPLLIGLGFIAAVYFLARRTVGAVSAGWALVVLAGSRNVARWGTELLSDLPAAACLLGAVAVIVDEVDREEGPRWRLLTAAPLLAAALHVRYGSAVPIAVIVVASVVVGARTLARKPWPAVATAVLFLVLLLPHFLYAMKLTGSPLGILLASRSVPQQEHLADGLITYVTSNPFKWYGLLTPFVLVAGLVALRIRDRRRLLVWLIGLGSLIAIGLTTHAQTRYVFISVAIFVVLGTDQIIAWLGLLPERVRRVVRAAMIVALVVVWALLAISQRKAAANRSYRMRGTFAAVEAIRADAAGRPCTVLGYHYTQLEWYSGCEAPLVMDGGAVVLAHNAGKRVYAVRDYIPTWVDAPQPVFSELPGSARLLVVQPGVVEVARIEPPAVR